MAVFKGDDYHARSNFEPVLRSENKMNALSGFQKNPGFRPRVLYRNPIVEKFGFLEILGQYLEEN